MLLSLAGRGRNAAGKGPDAEHVKFGAHSPVQDRLEERGGDVGEPENNKTGYI